MRHTVISATSAMMFDEKAANNLFEQIDKLWMGLDLNGPI